DLQRTVPHRAEMEMHSAGLLGGIAHRKLAAVCRKNDAGIADLPAGFGIERRLVEYDSDLVPGLGVSDTLIPAQDREDDALGGFGLVAEKFGRPDLLAQGEP